MRVLHVIRPAAGGMRRHLSLLAAGQSARGWTVDVAAPAGFALETVPGASPGTSAGVFAAPITGRPHPYHDLRAASAVARLARSADVVHGHGLRGAWIVALAARRQTATTVFTAHNLAPSRPDAITRTLLGMGLRRLKGVIAVSDAVRDSLAVYGVAPNRVMVVPNGVPLHLFDRHVDRGAVLPGLGWPEARDGALVLAVGRLSPEKGFDILIDATPHLAERCPRAHVVVAGDGPERAALERRIVEAQCGDRVRLVGRVDDIVPLLFAADVVAIPSREEGQGIVALEAMAARRPVVASRVGGLVGTVVDGQTGTLVAPEDPAALATALTRLLGDRELRATMGQSGRERVERLYTVARMVDGILDAYRVAGAPWG